MNVWILLNIKTIWWPICNGLYSQWMYVVLLDLTGVKGSLDYTNCEVS